MNLQSLCISAYLLLTPCLSADDSQQPHVLRLSPMLSALMSDSKQVIISSDPEQLFEIAQLAFDNATNLDSTLEKSAINDPLFLKIIKCQKALFGDAIQLAELYLSNSAKKNPVVRAIRSVSSYRLGCNLYNLGELAYLDNNHLLTMDLLRQSTALLSRSIDFFKEDADAANIKRAESRLASALNLQGVALIKKEEAEKNPLNSIDLFSQGIKALHSSYNLANTREIELELSGTIGLAIKKALEVFTRIQNEASSESTAEAVLLLGDLNELISLCQSIPLTQPIIEIVAKPNQKTKTSARRNKRSRVKQPSQFINLEEFRKMIVSHSCGLLQRLGRTEEAIQLYTTALYTHEFEQDSLQEQAFIQANLQYFAGDSKPLTQFYKELRRQKMIRTIKAQQEKMRQPSPEKPKTQSPKLIPAPSSASPSYSQDDYQVPISSATVHTPPKPPKIKTRGVPSPESLETNRPDLDTITKTTTELDQPMIDLNAKSYKIFLDIISDPLAKKITLPDAIKLLINLGCKYSKDKGKGVHQKITAPDGQIWTAPQDWGNRIPDYYKLQLAKFIQDSIGVDPDLVRLSPTSRS